MKRRWIAALIAASVVASVVVAFIGRDKIAGTPVLPGFDSGLSSTIDSLNGANSLTLRTTGGDLDGWLCLKFKSPPPNATKFTSTSGQVPLSVSWSKDQGHSGWLEIRGTKPESQGKFKWLNGESVVLSSPTASPLDLDDWILYLDKGTDQASWATRRIWFFWIMLALLLLAMPSAVAAGLAAFRPEKPADQLATAQSVILQIILNIGGTSDAEIELRRSFLSKVVLQNVSIQTALSEIPIAEIRPKASQVALSDHLVKQSFFLQARSAFLERLDSLITELIAKRTRLITPRVSKIAP
jgi:hypothetical protein